MLARYSTVALICFIVVAHLGYVSAALRIGTLRRACSPRTACSCSLKVAALIALGLFGAVQRRFLIGRMQRRPRRTAPAGIRRP